MITTIMSILFQTPKSTNKWQSLQTQKKLLLAELAQLFEQVRVKKRELNAIKSDILDMRESDDRKLVYIDPVSYDFDKLTDYLLDEYEKGKPLPVTKINGALLGQHIGRKRVKQAMLEAGFKISEGLYKY